MDGIEFIRRGREAVPLAVVFLTIGAGRGLAQVPVSVRGAWRPTTYHLKNGVSHPVDGLIVFTKSDWSVVYFVLDADGKPGRGSGEGGTYTRDGNRLVFTHRFNLVGGRAMEGLEEAPLAMTVRGATGAPIEPSTIELTPDRLVIAFPSGNRLDFRRSSPPD